MAAENPDTTAVKVESSTENGNTTSENNAPHGNEQSHTQNPGNRRGGGRFAFGNRRPNFNNMKTENNEFFGRKRMNRGGNHGGGGGPRDQGPLGNRNPDDRLNEKVAQLSGPTFDLQPIDTSERRFSGRSRLYIGNIAAEVTEEELNDLFKQFGETNELFVNKEKNFGFIRLDFHASAEKAKRELDGTMLKGRSLKIRFAPNGSTVKVKNLIPFVSNELLQYAFGVFGEIERSSVIVDDRGKSTGEGIIEYARKGSAALAIRKCTESCYFLTASLRPVIVEPYEIVDDTDGYPDKSIPKKNAEYMKEREVGPRFANVNGFEHEYGTRWKQLHELYSQKEQALKKELDMEKEKLEAQMEYARYEHETELLREQLRARELDRDRQKREWEIKERQADEARQRNEEQMRRQQEEMQARMMHQEEELRRRHQENSLFMQAHQLDNMLDQQEQNYEQPEQHGIFNSNIQNDMGDSGNMPMDPKTFMNTFDRNRRFEGREMGRGPHGGGGNSGGRGRWTNDNRGGNRDDFPNKRRRY
ncbi:hypothetical protein ILUMI_26987 [Ignelater luminosus]|uniref:RRM domain-containing protein n=1 Tax=Ignelater luminosus TaxID=2038154 RepID=A0A8K0C7F7_IGNLU|nr:hypothetical protein ILUMI_26987 [Ignelater luminosus]